MFLLFRGLHRLTLIAIASYEPRVLSNIATLDKRLSETRGQLINMTDMVFYFVGDLVGDIVFSVDFNMVRSGKKYFAAELLSAGFKPVGYINPIPWLFVLLTAIPGILGPWFRLVNRSQQETVRRLKVSWDPILVLRSTTSNVPCLIQVIPENPDVSDRWSGLPVQKIVDAMTDRESLDRGQQKDILDQTRALSSCR